MADVVNRKVNLAAFKELLLRTCGHSFEKDREQALSAAMKRRMEVRGIGGNDAYLSLLMRDSEELLRLTELLTVNETYFFREPDHLNLMVDALLPEFTALRTPQPVRIVSAGCSTGEEPYTIAMMLRERFGDTSEQLFDIIGVDIDSTVIATARQGAYGKNSFRGMNPALLDRYFDPCSSGRFQIRDYIKKLVRFEVVNLLEVPYPERMQQPDVILYRNVSIYFPGQVQREIFGKLAELLSDGGVLLVGASETLHHDVGILSLVKQDSLFYYRKTPPLVFVERRASSRFSSPVERPQGSALRTVPSAATRSDALRSRSPERHAPVPPRKRHYTEVKEQFDEALRLAHLNQYDKALDILVVIIEEDSTFEKAYSLKGSLLMNASRFDEARAVCETILGRDPLCLEAYLMLGMIARQKGNADEALKRFREAIYLDSSCWLAHFHTAEILFAQKDDKRSRNGYDTTLKILGSGPLKERGQAFFPLSYNAEQFITICRHKLSLLGAAQV
jgi:chemotaxis protein methyltransferase CheR